MKIVQKKKLIMFSHRNGQQPLKAWLDSMKSMKKQDVARIFVRLDRLSLGNYGDHKFVGKGVSELRLPFGPGYRIYYAELDVDTILLLTGGDKSTQKADIPLAQEYWKLYCRGN